MKRTISAMVGKGSVNHNSRKFKAENVDPSRTHLNIDYCNENIKKVYHQLFDEALKRYNDKQTRADRKIKNYYEKICNSKQEKPFHEIILQIGNKEDMSAESENGLLAKQVLDEYYKGFQERNPQLKVFSVHLHMDEATPHLRFIFIWTKQRRIYTLILFRLLPAASVDLIQEFHSNRRLQYKVLKAALVKVRNGINGYNLKKNNFQL